MTLAVQVVGDGPGELPGVGTEADCCGLLDAAENGLVLRAEPAERFVVVRRARGSDAGLGYREDDRVPVRIEQSVGGVGGVEVVVEHPVDGFPALLFGIGHGDLLDREGAQQVVWAVSTSGVLVDQMVPGKAGQERSDVRRGKAGEACCGRCGDVRSGV